MAERDTTPARLTPARVLLVAVLAIVVALGVAVLIAAVLSFHVKGTSMTPTLSDGDRILVDPFSDGSDVGRFEIVALRHDNARIVKRVIGLPGDEVRIDPVDDGAEVFVRPRDADGWQRVAAPVWRDNWGDVRRCCGSDGTSGAQRRAVVPDGSYFVLGDNPAISDDSRVYGWVRSDDVGQILLRVYPLERVGGVSGDFRLVPAG